MNRRAFLQFLATVPAAAVVAQVPLAIAEKLPEIDPIIHYGNTPDNGVIFRDPVFGYWHNYYIEIAGMRIGLTSLTLDSREQLIYGIQEGDIVLRAYPGLRTERLICSTNEPTAYYIHQQFCNGEKVPIKLFVVTPETPEAQLRIFDTEGVIDSLNAEMPINGLMTFTFGITLFKLLSASHER